MNPTQAKHTTKEELAKHKPPRDAVVLEAECSESQQAALGVRGADGGSQRAPRHRAAPAGLDGPLVQPQWRDACQGPAPSLNVLDYAWRRQNSRSFSLRDPSFRALSGRLKFTVRRHKSNTDIFSPGLTEHGARSSTTSRPRVFPAMNRRVRRSRNSRPGRSPGWLGARETPPRIQRRRTVLHPQPSTLNLNLSGAERWALHPRPWTLNLNPEPQTSTLNPQP